MLNAISRMTSPDKVREAILTSMISMNVMRRGAAVPIIYSSQLAFGKSEKRSIPNHYISCKVEGRAQGRPRYDRNHDLLYTDYQD